MDVKLPKLGEGAESGTVASILIKVGDTVAEGQTLIEVENEKAVAPIPSPAGGRVASVRVKEGDRISAGQVILSLADGEAASTKAAPAVAAPARAAQVAVESEPAPAEDSHGLQSPSPEAPADEPHAPESRFGPAASPSIRKLARELGIDLTRVRGSERGGRIVLTDLRAYIQKLQQLAQAPKGAAAPPPAAKPAPPAERIDFAKWGPIIRKPLSSLRQTIGRRMAESWNTVPRVTQFDEADITALLDLRKQFAPAYEKAGTKLTLTSFALKIVANTLKKHPLFNASLDVAANELVFKEYFHLGLAVDTEQGLIVPVIRDVDKKSLLQLSQDIEAVAAKARERKIALDDLKGGTFTISNQGGIGGAHFTPIVNVPEVAILGLGRGAQKPAVRDGKIEARWLLPLAISYDHRVIDGGSAARFCVDLKAGFENFPAGDVKL